jgi:beta-N-acetylglucosaminidase
MEGLGRSFVEAEQKYGVNALFLTSLAIHESAYGSSKIAKDKNNLFGFAAYDGSPYSSARTFTTKEQGIDHVASYLSENYLTEGGKYYGGATVEGVGKRYATDPNWANAIRQIIDKLMQK